MNSLIDIVSRSLVLLRRCDGIARNWFDYQVRLPGTISEMVVRVPVTERMVIRFFWYLEPVSSSKPKFPMTENSRTYTTYTVQRERALTLPCPAQAFPVPVFRYAKNRRGNSEAS